jgi:hypothetical protein
VQYERVVVRTEGEKADPEDDVRDHSMTCNRNGIGGTLDGERSHIETVGWRQVCACRDAGVEPCVVLDPFMGSGTTAATAIMYGRRGVGCDLNETYLRENAIPRIEAAIKGDKVRKPTKELPQGTPLEAQALTLGKKL